MPPVICNPRLVNTGTPENPGPAATWLYSYDPNGRELFRQDPRGAYFTTFMEYDELGRLTTKSSPRGLPEDPLDPTIDVYIYDAAGRMTVKEGPLLDDDGELVKTFFEYDNAGRQIKVTNPLGYANEYEFDRNDNIVKETYLGHSIGEVTIPTREVTHQYDQIDRAFLTIDTLGRELRYQYDEVNQIVQTIGPNVDENGNPAEIVTVYDAAGRLRSMTDQVNATTIYGYDNSGNRTHITDGRGDYYTTVTTYDGAGRVIEFQQPTGTTEAPGQISTQTFSHDRAGNIFHQFDDRGEDYVTTTIFDSVGNVASIDHPDGRSADDLSRLVERFEYDLGGYMSRQIDPRGEAFASTYQFDAAGNLLRRELPDGTTEDPTRIAESFTYDEGNNRTSHVGFGGSQYVTTFEVDDIGRTVSMTDAVGDTIAWDIDRFGNPVVTTDKFGTTERSFDAGDRPLVTTDPLGHQTLYQYPQTAVGEVVLRSDERGFVSEIRYDAMGRPVRETDPLGTSLVYQYDAAGNPIQITDKRGFVHTVEFDARNLALVETTAKGTNEEAIIRFEYDQIARQTLQTDPRDPTGEFYAVTTEYDALSRPIRSIRSAATPEDPTPSRQTPGHDGLLVHEVFYDTIGNLVREVPEGGSDYAVTMEYDRANRLTETSSPSGTADQPRTSTYQNSYNANGDLVEVIDALGHIQRFEYDAAGRRTASTILADGRDDLVETYDYIVDSSGVRTVITDATGAMVQTSHYDPMGRVDRVEYRDNPDLVRVFDPAGNLQSETQGRWSMVRTYDPRNHLLSITDGEDKTDTYEFDAAGNMVMFLAAGDTVPFQTFYDGQNRRTLEVDAVGGETKYDYDSDGNLISVADPGGTETEFVYDGTGRLLRKIDPTGTESRIYDAAGHWVQVTDHNNRVRTFEVDRNGDMRAEHWLDSDGNVIHEITFDIDADGRVTNATDGDYGISIDLYADNSNHLRGQTLTYGDDLQIDLSRNVDAIGRTTDTSAKVAGDDAFATTTYDRPDSDQRLKSISLAGGFAAAISVGIDYFADLPDSISSLEYHNPAGTTLATTLMSLDNRALSTEIVHSVGTNVAETFTSAYFDDGQVATETDVRGLSEFFYDDANQLLGVDRPGDADEVYSFDLAGNRTDSNFDIGTANQVESGGGRDFTYDDQGNLITVVDQVDGTTITYQWDYRNRLTLQTTVDDAGNVISEIRNEFDAFDHRVRQTTLLPLSPGESLSVTEDRYFVYDGSTLAAEFVEDESSVWTPDVVYLYNPETGSVYGQTEDPSEFRFLLKDRSGSTRIIVDETESVAARIHYDAYGNVVEHTDATISSRILYTGSEFDAGLGLYYLNARYYDPSLGRFLSADPSGFGGNDTNLYRYAGGDPANGRDPSGFSEIAIGGLSNATRSLASQSRGLPAGFGGRHQTVSLQTGLSFGATSLATASHSFVSETLGVINAAPPALLRMSAPVVKHAIVGLATAHQYYFGGDGTVPETEAKAIAHFTDRFNKLGELSLEVSKDIDRHLARISGLGKDNRQYSGEFDAKGNAIIEIQDQSLHFQLMGEAAFLSFIQGIADVSGAAVDLVNHELAIAGGIADRVDRKRYSKITKAVEQLGFLQTAKAVAIGISQIPSDLVSHDPAKSGAALGIIIEMAVGSGAIGKGLAGPSKAVTRTGGKVLSKFVAQPVVNAVRPVALFGERLLSRLPTPNYRMTFDEVRRMARSQPEVPFDQIRTQIDEFFNSPDARYRLRNHTEFEVQQLREIAETVEISRSLREPPKNGNKEGFTVGKHDANPIEHYIFDEVEGFANRIKTLKDPKWQAETGAFQSSVQDLVRNARGKLDSNQLAMVGALEELMGPVGRIGLPNIWNRLNKVISEQVDVVVGADRGGDLASKLKGLSADKAAEVIRKVDEIWTRDQVMSEISAQFIRDSAYARHHGIAGIFERGSFGASADQFLSRARKVHGIVSGKTGALELLDGKQWSTAWRSVSDLFKTPLGSASDFDFNIVTLNEKLFDIIHQKGIGDIIKDGVQTTGEIVGKQFVDEFFDFAKTQLEKRLDDADAGSQAYRQIEEQLEVFKRADAEHGGRYRLIELYKQDQKEFRNLNTYDKIVKGPVEKGAHGYLLPFQDYLWGPTSDTGKFAVSAEAIEFGNRLRAKNGDLKGDNVPDAIQRLQLRSTSFSDGMVAILNRNHYVAPKLLRAQGIYGPLPMDQTFQIDPALVEPLEIDLSEKIDQHHWEDDPCWDGFDNSSLIVCGNLVKRAWEDAIGEAIDVSVQFEFADLPAGVLGMTTIDSRTELGLASDATILIDEDGAGWGWTSQGYDLSTVLLHEMGHAVGFDPAVPGFAAAIKLDAVDPTIELPSQTATLQSNYSEFDPILHPTTVMAGSLLPGVSKTITSLDIEAIQAARVHSATTSSFTDRTLNLSASGGPSFVLMAEHLMEALASGPTTGLSNHGFAVSDSLSDAFAWNTIGDIAVADGTATISEDVGMISDLSQTFVIPQGVNTLTFTLGGLNLDVGQGEHPVEAFEVSLLDANTTSSLLGEMDGLGGGDALLNVQAGGEVFFADSVAPSGVSDSGDLVDLSSQSIDVTVSIPRDAAGKTATLYFDLIGFGDDASSAVVSNVELDTASVETGWQNPIDRYDVSDRDGIGAMDALLIINQIAAPTVHDRATGLLVDITDEVGPPSYYDVNGDGRLTAFDALLVINELERLGEAEDVTWQNPVDRFDVSGTGNVNGLDALLVINELATAQVHDRATGRLPTITDDVGPAPYFDVNGDGRLGAIDALQVVNRVRDQAFEPEFVDAVFSNPEDD